MLQWITPHTSPKLPSRSLPQIGNYTAHRTTFPGLSRTYYGEYISSSRSRASHRSRGPELTPSFDKIQYPTFGRLTYCGATTTGIRLQPLPFRICILRHALQLCETGGWRSAIPRKSTLESIRRWTTRDSINRGDHKSRVSGLWHLSRTY